MKKLAGMSAVVTGGGRGIGRAAAEALAGYGCRVYIGSRTLEQVEEAAAGIRQSGGQAAGSRLDVTDPQSVTEFMETAKQANGSVDILVCCAGINRRHPAEDYPLAAWDDVMGTNLKGVYLCCREAGKIMIDQGRGSIVNVTSMTSHVATPNQSAYAASKGGLLLYTKVLAVEWGRHNIRVNAVSPGYIKTELTRENFKNEKFQAVVMGKTPMRRFGGPDEVADAVCYLASPHASYITGACLPVDGGFLAGHPQLVMQ